jgi:hypothetical protein
MNKPSVVAMPSAAEKGVSKLPPDCDFTTRSCAKEAKGSDYAERSGKRVPLGYNRNQRAAEARTNAERPAVCKTKRL